MDVLKFEYAKGVLWASQYIGTDDTDNPSMAARLLRESGMSRGVYVVLQRMSQHNNEEMAPIFADAFDSISLGHDDYDKVVAGYLKQFAPPDRSQDE